MRAFAVAGLVIFAGCAGDTNQPRARDAQVSSTETSIAHPANTADSAFGGVGPVGFERTRAQVTTADGASCELCLWIAASARQRAQGLMGVTDLGAADGMAFVYPRPITTTFWMHDTLLPLSIAFFAADGAWLGEFDMEPCRVAPCPQYRTAERFTVAVEVTQGRLAELGIGDGSRLTLLDLPCEPEPGD